MYFSKYIHYSNSELPVRHHSQKFQHFEAQDKMNTLPRTAGTFQAEAKTCSKKEKALTEIEERRINYSSITY